MNMNQALKLEEGDKVKSKTGKVGKVTKTAINYTDSIIIRYSQYDKRVLASGMSSYEKWEEK